MSGWGDDSAAAGWDSGAGPGPLVLGAPTKSQARLQRTQRSLPGPAGHISVVRPTASASTFGSGGRFGSGGGGGLVTTAEVGDPDFHSRPWLQALQEADADAFDEGCEPFKGNTVRAASSMQQSGVLDRLLAVVTSVKGCHSGEAFVRLKDPTGTIGGTLTRAALEGEPGIRQGAVLLLCRTIVLRTPPPRSLSHLCIVLDSVVQVIPPLACPTDGVLGAATQRQQQPPRMLPALPAPPLATGYLPAVTQLPGPSSSLAWPLLGAAPAPPPSLGGRLPQPEACAHPAQSLRQQQQQQQHTSSFAWPSIGAAAGGLQPRQHPQHMPPPPARLPPRPGATSTYQHEHQPAPSESVNFSMPSLCQTQQHHHQTWQDDATSLHSGQQQQQRQAGNTQQSPTAVTAQQPARAPAGWLQGLLAEADFDPFVQGLLASQVSRPPAGEHRRPVLVERQLTASQQQQQQQPGSNGSKRQCTSLDGQVERGLHQHQQVAASGAVFGEADELDLDEWGATPEQGAGYLHEI